MARTNRPDEAYHIPTLNFWFAISSIALLITCVWMIWADYDRSWKNHQREFREFEIARLSNEKALAESALEEGDVKDKLASAQAALVKAETAVKSKRSAIEAVDREIEAINKRLYVAKQNYNFKGADLGDVKYEAEHDFKKYAGKKRKLKAAQAKYDAVVAEIDALKTAMLDEQDALEDAEAKRAELLKDKTSAETTIMALRGEVIKTEKALKTIEHNFFNDVFRDAPVVDFIRPTIKINQIVIPDLRDDYNFATVQKEDRCQTCHLGIDKKTYELRSDTGRFTVAATRAALEADLWEVVMDTLTYEAPKADHEDLLADFEENFAQNPEMTLAGWANENLSDWDGLAAAVLDDAEDAIEQLRWRTSVYGAHPDLDLFLTSMSPHPKEEIGCTSCHEGRGHAVEFQRVYHTPRNKEQQAQWEDKYNWHAPHYWDHPQLPVGRITASCAKCHDADVTVAGADAYNEGKRIVQQVGCPGCHQMGGITENLRKAGPDLRKYAAKVTDKDFAYQWIWDPQAFRPSSKMPRFFDQTNNGYKANPEFFFNTQQEVRGIVAYLYGETDPYSMDKIPVKGNVARGDKLFDEVGCLGCHSKESDGSTVNDHGPDLSGIGSKLSEQFIYNWIRDPKGYFADTHMPSLRLTEQEGADIAAYLAGELKEDWKTTEMPDRNTEIQTTLLRNAMAGTMRRTEIEATLDKMSPDDKEFELGRRALIKYGCTGCHTIKGMEDAAPIGAELTTWASKFKTQLDFGNIGHDEMDHNHIEWLTAKLTNPRIYDKHKETTKSFDELLQMPKFNFTQDEIDKVVTFILSRTKRHIGESKWPEQSAERQAVQAGGWLVEQYNCKGCHYFQGEGGDFAQYWEVDSAGNAVFKHAKGNPHFDYLEDVEGPVRGHVPPVLIDQGNKTEPAWLFGFFEDPIMLRPKLKMRMPSFEFSDEQSNKLIKMFAGIEGHGLGEISSYEPDPQLAVIGQQLFENGKCTRCHLFTDKNVPRAKIPAGIVAPNLKLTAERLQHTWTPRWLEDPQSIMPGANMPNYFDMENKFTALDADGAMLGQDMHKGMNALRDYLELSGQKQQAKSKRASK